MELVIINRPQVLPYQKINRSLKRVLDLFLCLVTLPVTLPLMAICLAAIRLDSPGPALFVQERVGLGGRRFRMYKFRTMRHNLDDRFHRAFMKAFVRGQIGNTEDTSGSNGADGGVSRAFVQTFAAVTPDSHNGNGKAYKPFKASQVTRVGRILRKTSLDELPQIFNVLKGEMSVVGPRPNVPWEVEEYQPWHHERLEVLPGITGLAQVKGRSAITFDAIARYDIEYVEQQSLATDLRILWWTVSTVVQGVGAE